MTRSPEPFMSLPRPKIVKSTRNLSFASGSWQPTAHRILRDRYPAAAVLRAVLGGRNRSPPSPGRQSRAVLIGTKMGQKGFLMGCHSASSRGRNPAEPLVATEAGGRSPRRSGERRRGRPRLRPRSVVGASNWPSQRRAGYRRLQGPRGQQRCSLLDDPPAKLPQLHPG